MSSSHFFTSIFTSVPQILHFTNLLRRSSILITGSIWNSRNTILRTSSLIIISLEVQIAEALSALRALSPTQSWRPSGSSTLISSPEWMARRSDGILSLDIPVPSLISSLNLWTMIVARQHKRTTSSASLVITSHPSPVNFTKDLVKSSFLRCGLICLTNLLLTRSRCCVKNFSPAFVEPIISILRQTTIFPNFFRPW